MTLYDLNRARSLLARSILRIAILSLAFRVASAALGFITNVVFPAYTRIPFTMFANPSTFWDPFVRYDSGWYVGIARDGYAYAAGGRSNIAYFPVYPFLMRYIGRLFGRRTSDFFLGGIVVSWTSFVLAMILLFLLARLDLPRRRAERAVLLAAIFPFAFFFGVAYPESTFMLFTLAAFYCFRTRRWALGGLAGAVATATRVNGIMMWPALAWIAWRAAEPTTADRARAAFGLVLAVCGFGAYCLYIYTVTGNPFEWAATLERWGYHPGGNPVVAPVHLLQLLSTHPYAYLAGDRMAPYDTLNGLTAIVFTVSIPFVWRRLGAGYALFMIANLWLPLSSGVFEGLGRYCAVLFPFFIWAATWRSRALTAAIMVASAMLYTLGLALFTTIHPLF